MYEKVNRLLRNSRRVVVICGAGISTSAGIPDFKTTYTHIPNLKRALTIPFRDEDSEALSNFLLSFYDSEARLKPTITHTFLHSLAQSGRMRRCYTMNIDGLERRAGLRHPLLVEVHGNAFQGDAKCGNTKYSNALLRSHLQDSTWRRRNKQQGCTLRPDIVFYGENARGVKTLQSDIENSDLVLCLGTSLSVYPMAHVVNIAYGAFKPCVLINNDRTIKPQKGMLHICEECDTYFTYFNQT